METDKKEIRVLIPKDKLAGVPNPKRYITEQFVAAGIPAAFDDRDILIAHGKLAYLGQYDQYIWTLDDSDAKRSA